MRSRIALALVVSCAVAVSAQGPSSSFPRGNSRQAWQDPGLAAVVAKCKTPPQPFSIPVQAAGGGQAANAAPPEPPPSPPAAAIPGVIAAGQTWKVVWSMA